MKKLKAFTLIETLVVISILAILAAMLLPALSAAKKKVEQKQRQEEVQRNEPKISIGDTVYVDGLDITGRVNNIWEPAFGRSNSRTVDILVKGINGLPQTIEKINIALVKKIVTAEDWRK